VGPVVEGEGEHLEVGKMHLRIVGVEVGIEVVAFLGLGVGSHLRFGQEGMGVGMEVRRLEEAFVVGGMFRLPWVGRLIVSSAIDAVTRR
jgi:hypothetical protein